MDKKRIGRFRKRLEQEQRAILLSLQRGRLEKDDFEIDHSIDEADVAVSTYQKEIAVALQESEASRLKAIAEALLRIEAGEWGLCAICEEPIPETRLDAVPWATKCLRCQDRIDNARRK